MTCIYNPDNLTKALLKKYEHVLGSYEAAYYVISLNNGLGLDLTPDGKISLLYADLKSSYGEDQAIRMKAMTYTKPFYNQYGDWTMGQGDPVILDLNGEPKTRLVDGGLDAKMQDIMNNYFLRDDLNDLLDVLNFQTDPINPEESSVALQKILNTSYDVYVKLEVKKATDKSPEGIRKAKRQASHEWYKRKVKLIVQEQQLTLAKAFELDFVTNNDGSIELRGLEEYEEGGTITTKLLRIKFIQNLNYDPLEEERRQLIGELPLDENFKETDPNHDMYVADAVIDSIHEDMFTAKNGLIYISLNNGSAATVNKVLAYHYIMSYYDSELVQSALESIEPASNGKSKMYRVSKLIEHLTGVGNKDAQGTSILERFYANNKDLTTDQVKQAEFFLKFWDEFDQLNDQIINKGIKSTDARRKILSTLAAAIMVNSKNTDRFTVGRPMLDLRIPMDFYFRYMPSSKEKLRLQENKHLAFLNSLKTAYQNRKERSEKQPEDQVNKNAIAKMMMALLDLKSYRYTNIKDIQSAITTFLENAGVEIYDAINNLDSINTDPYDSNAEAVNEVAKKVSSTYSDVIGFYKSLIEELNEIIRTNDALNTVDINRLKSSVINDLNTLDGLYREKLSDTAYRVVDLYIDQYWGDDIVSPSDKQNMKANAHAYLRNQAMNGDIASYETLVTMNNYSRSPICKIVINAILRINRKREQRMRTKATELTNLLNKTKRDLLKQGKLNTALLGNNFLRVFQELDELGIPTGNFVRELNYGKFYKLRNAKIAEIITDIENQIRNELGDTTFSLELDKHDHPIFPEDDFFEKYWKQYLIKLNHFDCTYANKMYTEDYYEKRINMLSRKTITAMNDILDKIDIILTPVMQEGIPHPERLSHEDLIDLLRLLILQETLSSRYDIFGQLKTGDDLQIAEEILAFRDAVKDGRKFKANQDKYDKVTLNMTASEKDSFDAFMTSYQITPEYWEMYNTLKEEYRAQFPPQFDSTFARMDEINKEKRELMSYFQGRHYYQVNIESMSDEAFAKIRDLDIEYSDLCLDLNNYLSTLTNEIDSPFSQIGDSDLIPANNATVINGGLTNSKFYQFIQDALEKDRQESAATGVPTNENYYKAISLYTVEYIDHNGQPQRRPTSAFSYFKPKRIINQAIINRFGVDPLKLILKTPNKSFNELVGGIYKNPDYDSNNPERLQPKEKNPQYDYIKNNKALKDLYYALLDTMSESNSMIPNTRNNSNFRLPQIGASSMTVYSRNKAYNPIPGVSYMLDRNFNVNETDTEINDDFYTLPDGTRINSVPMRYVLMLRNPANITADVVGSVIAYYDMAVNFELKSAAAPTMELLLLQVGQASVANGVKFSGRETSQYSKLNNIMESKLYDNEAVWGTNRTLKLSTGKKRMFKAQKFLSNLAVRMALARNFISYGTGFIDAFSRLWSQAITGDLFNVSDFFKGLGYVMHYIGSGHFIGNVASYLPNNHLSALMWRMGLSTGNLESFEGTHKSRFRRSMKDVKTGMAGFRVSDFLINGILTSAIYHNMRYYEKDGVGTFLNEREWINRYLKDNPNATLNKAKKNYHKADVYYKAFGKNRKGIPLYGEIESLYLKDKYNVSEKELERLDADTATLLHTQAAKVNGAVYDEDKPGMHQNPVLKTFSSLRNYLVNDFQTRWATGDDFLNQDTSILNINKLKALRRELSKALREVTKALKKTGKAEYADAIDEIDDKIVKLEDKIRRTTDNSVMFNPEYIKEAAKAMFMGIPVGMAVGSNLALGSSLLFTGIHGIVFGASTVLGGLSAAALSLYNNATKPNSIIINRKLSLMDQKIALEYIKSSLLGGPDAEQLRQELNSLDRRITELERLNKLNKGYANWALRLKALGYNRAMGSAFSTMMQKLKFFYRTHFVDSWKDLSSVDLVKMKPKLTPQELTGLRKGLGDISNIIISMIIATFFYGFKMDDPDVVLPAKITDSVIKSITGDERITRDALGKLYKWGDDKLVSFYSAILENEPVQNAAKSMYDVFQNNNVIPFDDDIFERMIERKLELVLGIKPVVSSKTGKIRYKKIPASRLAADLDKSYKALQSLRAWSEIVQPYDPTSVNDYLSTPSATNNVLFKSLDAQVNLINDEIDGKADKYVQRSAYTSFTKRQYYGSKSPWFRFTGIPTVFEETEEAGLDARFVYTRGLGFGPIIFPKPEQTKSHKSKSKRRR